MTKAFAQPAREHRLEPLERTVVLLADGGSTDSMNSLAGSFSKREGCEGLSAYSGRDRAQSRHLASSQRLRILMVIAGLSGNIGEDTSFVADLREAVGDDIHMIGVLDQEDSDYPSALGEPPVEIVREDLSAAVTKAVKLARESISD